MLTQKRASWAAESVGHDSARPREVTSYFQSGLATVGCHLVAPFSHVPWFLMVAGTALLLGPWRSFCAALTGLACPIPQHWLLPRCHLWNVKRHWKGDLRGSCVTRSEPCVVTRAGVCCRLLRRLRRRNRGSKADALQTGTPASSPWSLLKTGHPAIRQVMLGSLLAVTGAEFEGGS